MNTPPAKAGGFKLRLKTGLVELTVKPSLALSFADGRFYIWQTGQI